MGKTDRWMPRWASNLGEMIKEDTRVRIVCRKCKAWHDIDPKSIAVIEGTGFSLIDYVGTCVACGEEAIFLGSSPHRFFFPLQSPDD